MELKDLFYPWVPLWIKLPVLFLLLFVILSANGVYLGNGPQMYGGLAVYEEPYTEAFNAVYIGMGLAMMIEVRLKRRFSNKTLLLWGLTVMLLMNLVCMLTDNPYLVVAACLVLGFCKMAAFVEVFVIWVFIWSKKLDRTRVYPFLYFTALSGIYFVTWWTAKLAVMYNWRYAYIGVLILILASLLLSLLLVNNNPIRRIYPLYQMDWLGMLLLLSLLLLTNYVAVYGKVEDWFESTRIKAALILIPLSLLGFVLRELKVRRPLIPPGMFRTRGFLKGLLFFIALGIFLPSSVQSLFTGGILHFELFRNSELSLYLIPGIMAGSITCFYWYYHKYDPDILLFLGFLAFAGYYYILYRQLATGLGLEDFWLSSLLKGFGFLTLYVVIGIYTVASFTLETVFTAAGLMIIFRSVLGSGVFTGLYSYFLYAGTVRHIDRLAGLSASTASFPDASQSAALSFRSISQQASLSATKELTGVILFAAMVVLAGIALSMLFRTLNTKARIFGQ